MASMSAPTQLGKYRIVREIGKGATATVYLAESPHRTEPVAIKLVDFGDKSRDGGKWSRRMRKIFQTEANLARQLEHPNIIRIDEAVVEEDRAYLVMEYFEGRSLDHFCTFDTLLPLHRVVGIVFKCCLALDYAARQGILHRDIKPANIMIDHDDTVKVTDFGLAMNLGKEVNQDSTFIMGVGSPAYMSPEQIKGYPLNHKTELYSLGVVLFHLLTGRLPFRARHPAQLIYKIINADTPSASALSPEIPEAMDAVIRKALEKDLYSRYKNGADFAKDLAAVRYKILDDKYVPPDMTRFSVLRKMSFFVEFDDVEVWETLRIGSWRHLPEHSVLLREGEEVRSFGLVLEGEVEVSIEGRRLATVGAGQLLGEESYLQPSMKQLTTAIAITPVVYLDLRIAALALASEEFREHFNQRITQSVAERLAQAQRAAAAHNPPASMLAETAVQPIDVDFELVPYENR